MTSMPTDLAATELVRGDVVWAELSPARGREQAGRRPALVVAGRGYLRTVTTLVVVLPVTSVERGWSNHVALRGDHGLARPSWAMTEQVRTISRDRVVAVSGAVDTTTLADVDEWLRAMLAL